MNCTQLVAILVPAPLLLTSLAQAGEVRVIPFSASKAFQMGSVTSRRIVHPDMGAKQLTLNLSVSKKGAEFAQHVHDGSDDTILVLRGEVDLRQGDSRTSFKTGEAAFVPAGQIHGTITTGAGENVMISFQTPPDLVLYTGARDSSKAGAAPPAGVITPGAVQFISFATRNGYFIHPGMGSKNSAAAHRKLACGEKLDGTTGPNAEQMFFVWQGSVRVKHDGQEQLAGEKDTVFIKGPARVEVIGDSATPSTIIQVQAPPAAIAGQGAR